MNDFFRQFSLGIGAWFESWRFIRKNNLTHYFIYPIILSILLGMGAVAFIRSGVRYVMSWITPHIEYTALPDGNWWNKTLDVLSDIGSYGIAFILWIIAFYTFRKASKYLTLALMSPVMALLSEKTEAILTGREYPFNGPQFVRDIVRGVLLAIRNFTVEILLSVVVIWGVDLIITLLFPPIGIALAPVFVVLSFCIGAYFYGFSTMDYYFERQRYGMSRSVDEVRKRKGLAVANGTVFNFLMMVPFIGVTVATITCTVAATIALHHMEPNPSNLPLSNQ
jgi:CysZ protein